jgi:hypothetical protein
VAGHKHAGVIIHSDGVGFYDFWRALPRGAYQIYTEVAWWDGYSGNTRGSWATQYFDQFTRRPTSSCFVY